MSSIVLLAMFYRAWVRTVVYMLRYIGVGCLLLFLVHRGQVCRTLCTLLPSTLPVELRSRVVSVVCLLLLLQTPVSPMVTPPIPKARLQCPLSKWLCISLPVRPRPTGRHPSPAEPSLVDDCLYCSW